MRSFRDIKRQARSDVHRELRVAALYLESPSATPVPCFVRVMTKFAALGDMKGTSFNYAERIDQTPRLILWCEELPEPKRNAIISVEPGEAYQIDNIEPADGQTITVLVVAMDPADIVSLPVPEV